MKATSRLRRLEAEAAAATPNREPDRAEQWFYGLCECSPLLGAIHSAAETRAIRRALAEDRYPNPWFRHPDLDELAGIERAELGRFLDASDGLLWEAIERWIAEPDVLGWPRPKTCAMSPVSDLEAFYITLRSRKQVVEGNRTGRAGDRWRRDNPEWRPGMSDAEHFAWDIERLDRAAAEGRW